MSAKKVIAMLFFGITTGLSMEFAAAKDDSQIVIGFSQGTMNHPWRVAMVEKNRQYLQKVHPEVKFVATDGQNSSSKQVSDVESLVAQGVDVLLVSPLTSDALTPALADAMDAGISVVTVDRQVNGNVTSHIGAHNIPIGEKAALFFKERLHGKVAVLEIQGTAGASATNERHKGLVDGLKGTDIKIVASQNADYLRENALKFVEDQLQRFGPGQLQAIFAHNDEMALGAIQALESAGRLKEVLVVGADGQESAFQAIKNGRLAATFIYPYAAPEAAEAAYKIAKGEKLPKEIELPIVQVDTVNVDSFIGKGF